MQKVEMGAKIRPIGIQRVVCMPNVLSRAILLDKNPRVKQIAYDNVNKRSIEVTQEACIHYKLNARINYYFLVAQLNTDMNGNVFGDAFEVKYLQMSPNVYDDFAEAVNSLEGGKFSSLKMKKVVRSEKDTYGYVKPTPDQSLKFEKSLVEKIKQLRSNTQAIESMWALVDAATSISVEEYEKLLAEKAAAENKPFTPMAMSFSETGPKRLTGAENTNVPKDVVSPIVEQSSESDQVETSKESEVLDDFGASDFGNF